MTKKEFKTKILEIATKEKEISGMDPLITATQAAHESGWGNSKLTLEANNLFGMTANDEWINAKKPVYEINTVEYSNYPPQKIQYWNRPGDIVSKEMVLAGSKLLVKVPFRKYLSWDESVRDWALKISTMPRYVKAYEIAKTGNIKEYGIAVKAAGYATDPNYPSLLANVGKEMESL